MMMVITKTVIVTLMIMVRKGFKLSVEPLLMIRIRMSTRLREKDIMNKGTLNMKKVEGEDNSSSLDDADHWLRGTLIKHHCTMDNNIVSL